MRGVTAQTLTPTLSPRERERGPLGGVLYLNKIIAATLVALKSPPPYVSTHEARRLAPSQRRQARRIRPPNRAVPRRGHADLPRRRGLAFARDRGAHRRGDARRGNAQRFFGARAVPRQGK